ncbi:glycosyltransferase [Salinarimonas chemoclinalis]|uniref:glycosyltransferase n=1 Tax=Salinarimonas chemoclinalis TaxID=3241599 RepID=UPI003556157D
MNEMRSLTGPGTDAIAPVTIVGSDAPVTCGVMDYARRLVEAIDVLAPGLVRIEPVETRRPLDFLRVIVSRLRRGETVHMQLPIEGWGNSLLPGVALFLARLATRRGHIVVTLHEWMSLNRLRYLSLLPDVWATDSFVFVSEHQRAAFRGSPVVARARREAATMIPIGPNIMARPGEEAAIAAERARIRARGDGRPQLVVGFFGVLYASKRPELLLETLAALRTKGFDARLVVCGDFLHDKPDDRPAFLARAAALGVSDALDFRGRIDDETELMTVLAACDAFLLPYTDGVSARRGTFHALAQIARPLVTTEPARADEFALFPALAAKIASPATRLVPVDAPARAFADALVAAHERREEAIAVDLASLWGEAARGHLALYEALRG